MQKRRMLQSPMVLKFDQPAAQAAGNGIGSRGRPELSQNGADVKLDGVFGDIQPERYLPISETFRQQLQNLGFTRSELFDRGFVLSGLRRERAVENRQPGGNRPDGLNDLLL